MEKLDAVVQERIDKDVDFQASIADLPDEEKNQAIATKKSEVINSEFESLSKKAQENEQKFKDQQARAKNAEEELKKLTGDGGTPKNPQDSLKDDDVLYIAKADIHSEDLPDLRTHMKNYGVGAKEAHDFLKPIFAIRQEERKTANTTQIKGGARGVSKTTGEDLLKRKNEKGEFPESEEDIDKMLDADFEARKKALKRN